MYLRYAFLADFVTMDAGGKLSANGIFDVIHAVSFPMKHRDMSIVVNLEGSQSEKGPHKITIEFRDDQGNKILGLDQNIELGNSKVKHGNLRAGVLLRMQDIPFIKPGQYEFVIFCDDRFLGRIIFHAQKIEVQQTGAQ